MADEIRVLEANKTWVIEEVRNPSVAMGLQSEV